MNLLIMNSKDAQDYEPNKLTYAIRILYGRMPTEFCGKLRDSDLYVIREYKFDDVSPSETDDSGVMKTVVLTRDISTDIITDFYRDGRGCSDLLIHCAKGQSRSPAVGIALNEIFYLGNCTIDLKNNFPGYNRHVYEMIKGVGAELF